MIDIVNEYSQALKTVTMSHDGARRKKKAPITNRSCIRAAGDREVDNGSEYASDTSLDVSWTPLTKERPRELDRERKGLSE